MPTGRILKTGLSDLYDARIKVAYSQAWDPTMHEYEPMYSTVDISTQDVRGTYISGFGTWQVKEFGGNVTYDSIYQGYDTTITPATYALAFTIEKETVQDDPHGLLGQDLASNLAQMGRYTVDVLAASQFNGGFAATTASPWMSGGDGQYFFDTDHPILSGGTYANNPSTECDFSVSALQAGLTNLRKTQGARGEIIPMKGEVIVAPVESEWLVKEILNSDKMPYTADNTNNVAVKGLTAEFWSFLTDSDCWFIRAKKASLNKQGRPSGPGATTICVWRQQPEFDRDNVFDSGDRRYKGDMRLGFGRWDWRGWYGSEGG